MIVKMYILPSSIKSEITVYSICPICKLGLNASIKAKFSPVILDNES